jgi:hypothetical protein
MARLLSSLSQSGFPRLAQCDHKVPQSGTIWNQVQTVSQTVSHWLSQLPKSLLLQQLGLEARVGFQPTPSNRLLFGSRCRKKVWASQNSRRSSKQSKCQTASTLPVHPKYTATIPSVLGGGGRNRRPTTFSPAASGSVSALFYGPPVSLSRPPRQSPFNALSTLAH